MDRNHFLSVAGPYFSTLQPEQVNAVMERHQAARAAIQSLQPLPKPLIEPMATDATAHLGEVTASPFFQQNFLGLKTSFGMVRPSDLIVFQHFVNGPKDAVPPDVLRWALPKEFHASAQIIQDAPNRVLFVTEDPTSVFQLVVDPQRGPVMGLQPRGNWIQVARVGDKLVLRNGMHRVSLLAAANQGRVPALIVDYATLAEVVPADPGFFNAGYLGGLARPPVITDFFNPTLTVDIPRQDTRRVVAVKLDVSEYRIPF